MRDGEGDQGFLPLREGSLREYRTVLTHELVPEFLIALAHLGEFTQIVCVIIRIHSSAPLAVQGMRRNDAGKLAYRFRHDREDQAQRSGALQKSECRQYQ